MINIFNICENTENAVTFPCSACRNRVLVTVMSREIVAETAKRENTHLCSLNYRAFFSSEMYMKLSGIKIEPKY